MGLHSANSAVFSAIIYNALIIVALIPLALKGVRYRKFLRPGCCPGISWSMAWGIIIPFIAIKAIDVLITAAGLVV